MLEKDTYDFMIYIGSIWEFWQNGVLSWRRLLIFFIRLELFTRCNEYDYLAIEKFTKCWGLTYIETIFCENGIIRTLMQKKNMIEGEKMQNKHKRISATWKNQEASKPKTQFLPLATTRLLFSYIPWWERLWSLHQNPILYHLSLL